MKVLLLLGVVALATAATIPHSSDIEEPEKPGRLPPSPGCVEHASQRRCGSACPPTCTHPHSMCMALICDNSCYCDEGYVLNAQEDKCVKLEQCPNYSSDDNLEFPEESNDVDSPHAESMNLELGAVDGSDENPTIAPEACQGNSTYTTCGTACPTTCSNRNNPPMFCTMQCVIGCQCKEGYMLTGDKERCILPDDCF